MKDTTKRRWGLFEKVLGIIASAVTIIGVPIISFSMCGPSKITQAENIIAQLKILQTREYIENTMDTPVRIEPIEYSNSLGSILTGERRLYYNAYCFTFMYYYQDTCIGYFIVSKDQRFNPVLFRDTRLFSTSLKNSAKYEDISGGMLKLLFNSFGDRADVSSIHIQYYYHHLGTNNCLIGIGLTDLGYINDYDNANSLFLKYLDDEGELYSREYIDGVSSQEYTQDLRTMKLPNSNVFSVFISEENQYDIDTIDFLKNELIFGIESDLYIRQLYE